MKGIVFSEFLEFVEQKHGYDRVDQILENTSLSTDGAFTSVGSYPFADMVQLLTETSKQTGLPAEGLLHEFGLYFFHVLYKGYGHFFEGLNSAFDLLGSLDNFIHPEVLKLYPDAELPRFDVLEQSESRMVMVYKSSRRMSSFALGLIESSLEHFKENAEITTEMRDETGEVVQFTIQKS